MKKITKMIRHVANKYRSMDASRKGRALATGMVGLAVLSTVFFGYKMSQAHQKEAVSIEEHLITGSEAGASAGTVEAVAVEYTESQVIREVDLGYVFDTENGVTVRNLETRDSQRVTEPGVEIGGDDGNYYSYIIEERNDGGQDLMVSLRSAAETSFLVSYQLINAETGDKAITNLTVVNGSVTAEITYQKDDLTASSR